jgi:hypothetical protein
MSLNDLPPELTDLVLSYLIISECLLPILKRSRYIEPTQIAKYACTSRNFQYAVERHLFLNLTLQTDDLSTFEALVVHSPRRRALLRSITFIPTLPDPKGHLCYSESTCQRANDKAFAAAMDKLYTMLYACDLVEGRRPLRLTLGPPRPPTDRTALDMERLEADPGNWEPSPRLDLGRHCRLQLKKQTDFAASKRVTAFTAYAHGPIYLALGSILTLLKSHPEVEDITIDVGDEQRKPPGVRTLLRMDFARRLRHVPFLALTKLYLSYGHQEPLDQRFVNADVRGTHKGFVQDALSTSLHKTLSACPKLKTVTLNGPICIDESLFWPHNTEADDNCWPDLESLQVLMSAVRPDGGWYLEGHPDFPLEEPVNVFSIPEFDSDDSDSASSLDDESDPVVEEALRTGNAFQLYFRSQPNESFQRVLEAAARAATTMPSLRTFSVATYVPDCPRSDSEQPVEFVYLAKGVTQGPGAVPTPQPQLKWCVPSEWKMSESLKETWATVLGPDGEISYDEW